MNRTSLFPALAFGGGALAFLLRFMQNRTGFDPSGLPVAGNLWAILLPVVLVLVLAAALILTGRGRSSKVEAACFEDAFSSFRTEFLALLAAGIFLLAISGALQAATNLGLLPDTAVLTASGLRGRSLSTGSAGLVEGVLTLLCAVCLFPTIRSCRCSGSRETNHAAPAGVNSLYLLLPVVAMVVRLVLRYRQDSVNPTLAAYYIPLLALVLVTMSLYLLAGFAFQSGSSRTFLPVSVMAIVLCAAALADAQPLYSSLFWLGSALSFSGYLCLHIGHLRTN